MDDYASFGIRYYWIVDPGVRSIEVYQRTLDGQYIEMLAVTGGTIEMLPGCDGFVLNVDQLWTVIEQLEIGT